MKSERFQTLVSQNPENEMFRFSLAQALFEEGTHEAAVPHFEACIQKKPDWMLAHILLAKAKIKLDSKEDAIALLKRALILAREQNHKDPEAEVMALLNDLGA